MFLERPAPEVGWALAIAPAFPSEVLDEWVCSVSEIWAETAVVPSSPRSRWAASIVDSGSPSCSLRTDLDRLARGTGRSTPETAVAAALDCRVVPYLEAAAIEAAAAALDHTCAAASAVTNSCDAADGDRILVARALTSCCDVAAAW